MIIFGSSRQGRKGGVVADWVNRIVGQDDRFQIDYVDIRELNLPFFDEPVDPFGMKDSGQDYTHPEGRAWADRVAKADTFIMITPEYNHSFPAVLKNAIDWVGYEWDNKPVGFISYGGDAGGSRSVEHLRQIVAELGMPQVPASLHFGNFEKAFDESGNPLEERFAKKLEKILSQLAHLRKS